MFTPLTLRSARSHRILAGAASAVLVVALGATAGRGFWELGTTRPEAPTASPGAESADVATTADRGAAEPSAIPGWQLFGEADADEASAETIEAPQTQLDLRLKGIVHARDSGRARALIAAGSGEASLQATGDTIEGGGRIHAIERDRVILRRGDQYESLPLEVPRVALDTPLARMDPERLGDGTGHPDDDGEPAAPAPEAPASEEPTAEAQATEAADAAPPDAEAPAAGEASAAEGGAAAPDAQEIEAALSEHLPDFRPAMEDGQMVGVRVPDTADPDTLAAIGLEGSDVVTAINDSSLDTPQGAFEQLESLRESGDTVELRIRRNGDERTIRLPQD